MLFVGVVGLRLELYCLSVQRLAGIRVELSHFVLALWWEEEYKLKKPPGRWWSPEVPRVPWGGS